MPDAHTAFNFISYQTGIGTVPFDSIDAMCELTKATVSPGFESMVPLCNFFVDETTNTANFRKVAPTAAYGLVIASGLEPLSKPGKMLYDELQKGFAKHAPQYGMKAVIGGTPAKELDMVATLYGTLPWAAVFTLTTAGIFLAIAFRSILIPIRSILSNCLTLGFVYGCSVLVYQYGAIDFLGKTGINGKYEALPWFSPVVSFFIITGVGLDYDIFVLVRITEYRGKGKDPIVAIQEGLISTGGIITAAGFVMILAYSGMLFSELIQATMFGFMMVLAVLYDTFIARCIVVPTGMSLLGYMNWWPSELARRGRDSRTFHGLDDGDLEELHDYGTSTYVE
jgi:RND superfamily putative drug exporter